MYHFYYLLSLLYLNTILGIVPELNSVSHYYFTTIRRDSRGEQVEKGGFARAVLTYNSHSFAPQEIIIELIEHAQVSEALAHIVKLHRLASQSLHIDFELYRVLLPTLVGCLLYLIKIVYTRFRLSSPCLRLPTHPVEFLYIKVFSLLYRCLLLC